MRLPPSLGAFGRTLAVSGAVVTAIGLLRLSRQFPAAAASPGLLVPFLLPVLALALETGGLVALSGAALSALGQVAGQPLAARLKRASLPLALLALVLMLAEALPRGTERPGAFANDLVQHARAGCGQGVPSVPVPLLGLTVRCAAPLRVEGPMPGVRSVQVAMRELEFSDDLRHVRIEGLELTAKRALSVHLQAGHASIAGLAPWTRSVSMAPLARLLLLGAIGSCLWLVAGLCWARSVSAGQQPRAPLLRALLGSAVRAGAGAVAAAFVIALDQEQAAPRSYWLAAAGGVAVLLALAWLARRAPKLFSYVSAF